MTVFGWGGETDGARLIISINIPFRTIAYPVSFR